MKEESTVDLPWMSIKSPAPLRILLSFKHAAISFSYHFGNTILSMPVTALLHQGLGH